MAGLLSRFTTFLPNATILSNDHNQELNRIVQLLNGTTTNLKTVLKTSDTGDPPLELDQLSTGPLLELYQGGILKASVNNTGQIETVHQFKSTLATGTKPLDVASTTKVDNLNADLLDGFSSADFASVAAHKTWWSITWFYPMLPSAVESVESVGRLIVPQSNGVFTVRDCVVTWAGGSDSGANNIFTLKRRNSAGTLQADLGTANVNSASQNVPFQAFTSTQAVADADQIYPLFTTRNTASETLVSITLRGTQTFGTN